MRTKIAIIDYGRGNVQSIINALSKFDVDLVLTSDRETILNADGVVLPGVGAFRAAMDELKKRDLVDTIKTYVDTGKFFLGICLGMQLLFNKSDEFGETEGLGIIEGEVAHFSNTVTGKLPHISWTQIEGTCSAWRETIFKNIPENNSFYFVHSHVCIPQDAKHVLARTLYGGVQFCSSVRKGNVYGCQFHPEKSADSGLKVLNNFVELIRES